MCYKDSLGIRELRQDASALVARVTAEGVSIIVTRHGRPMARLGPIASSSGRRTLEELTDAGLVHEGRRGLADVAPIPAPAGAPSTDELLAADRGTR